MCEEHTLTHTHKEHLPLYLPCASRANHSRELETQLMTYIQHLQDVRKKETQLHICTLKAVLYGMSVCVQPWYLHTYSTVCRLRPASGKFCMFFCIIRLGASTYLTHGYRL